MTALVSPAQSQGSILSLQQRWSALTDIEHQRNCIVQDLFAELERLRAENDRLTVRLSVSEKANETFLNEIRDSEAAVRRLTSTPFVVVLIDGDSTLFFDSFVAAGTDGGQRAAHGLQQALERWITDLPGLESDTTILVRIYHNATGFKQTYRDAGIADEAKVSAFLASFNAQRHLFEYIDAGQDSQAADNKIVANLDLFRRIESCKQIVLAGSADNGYVNHLRQFAGSPESAARITLIESIPFPQAFQRLSFSFKAPIKFDELFRTQKIIVSRSTATRASTATRRQSPIDGSEEIPALPTTIRTVRRAIALNQHGQRIDPRVEFDPGLKKGLQGRRLCSRHFLTHCPYPQCKFDHKGDLSQKQRQVLTFIARENVCSLGSGCRDPDCTAGHHCPNDRCPGGSKCRFKPSQHIEDKKIVEVIEE